MIAQLESFGMSFTGKDESGERMEVRILTSETFWKFSDCSFLNIVFDILCVNQIIELPDHPFFVGAQFHPEFKSRPGSPSPLFVGAYAAICCVSFMETVSLFSHSFVAK